MILKTSSHHERGFSLEPRYEVIHEATKVLCEVDFNTIIVTGISGMVMGSVLAYQMNKRLAVVRRDGEVLKTVAGMSRIVEGWLGGKYIFFDDLIASGSTKYYAIAKYEEACLAAGEHCKFIGSYLWNNNDWRPGEDL